MTSQPYNFCRPPRLSAEVRQRADLWLRAACALGTNRAAGQFPAPVQLALRGLDTVVCQDAQAALADTAVGYPLRAQHPEWSAVLAWPRPLLLALLEGLTGELSAQLPPDRELTAVEGSLADFLVREAFAAPLGITWPGQEPLRVEVGARDPGVKWARLYPGDRVLAAAALSVQGSFGAHECQLLLPADCLPRPSATSAERPKPPTREQLRERLEGLLQEAAVEVAVALGQTEVPLELLSRLKPGDVLVLGQRVRDPLTVSVGGRPRFLAWSGRVEGRQACQISSILDG